MSRLCLPPCAAYPAAYKLLLATLIQAMLLASFLASTLSAQFAIGLADRHLENRSGRGAPAIPCSIVYPAVESGVDQPVLSRPGGRACIVFLHGYGRWGAEYYNLALALAERGFVVVLPNSGQFSLDELFDHGLALSSALRIAATTPGHLLEHKLDLTRLGLVGHSYGGTTCARVLASDTSYRAGVAIAPVFVDEAVRNARLPFAVLHGTGDSLIPWRDGDQVYRSATSYREAKVFVRLAEAAQHLNVAGMELASDDDRRVWARCASILGGFLLRFVDDESAALREALGPATRNDALVFDLRSEIDQAQVFALGPARSGRTFDAAIAAEPGPFLLALGFARADIPTPFGALGLDPSTLLVIAGGSIGTAKYGAVPLVTPSDPRFIGYDFGLQALAMRARVGLRFSEATWITIER